MKDNGKGLIYDGAAAGKYAAEYWKGWVSRGEVQAALDPLAKTLTDIAHDIHGDREATPPQLGLVGTIMALDIMTAFLFGKLGATAVEFQAFVDKRMAEMKKQQVPQAQEVK